MSLTLLTEMASAGAFLAADADAAFAERFGPLKDIEFNFRGDDHPADGPGDSADGLVTADDMHKDLPVDVRVTTAAGAVDFTGRRIALAHESWHWLTAACDWAPASDYRLDPDLFVRAARGLVAGRPVLFAPTALGDAAVAIDFAPSPGPFDARRIMRACAATAATPGIDEKRALATTPQPTEVSFHPPGITDLPRIAQVALPPARPGAQVVTLPDLLADAHFISAEHQFFQQARWPNPQFDVDFAAGMARISSGTRSIEATAHVIATVHPGNPAAPAGPAMPGETGEPSTPTEPSGVWRWAWADDRLPGHKVRHAANNLRRFGWDHGLVDFIRPVMPASVAHRLGLIRAAMAVSGVWNLFEIPFDDDTLGLVLVDSPAFELPQLTDAVADRVLATPLPSGSGPGARLGFSRKRAVAAYFRYRRR